MADKIKTFAFILLAAMGLMLGAGLLGGKLCFEKGLSKCMTEIVIDTVVVKDTILVTNLVTDTVIKKIKVPRYVAVRDTIIDSIWVELPMEWHLASMPDTLDIWYHGYEADIDSIELYLTTTTITNTVVKTDYKTPRLTLDLGTGALYNQQNINPYLVGEICLNRPKTTFSAFGCINQYGDWAAGLNVTYRINIIK